ncbi:MAG: hypothetical protein GF308_01470 [Candidatus Heimdallarchaeota archaeon]|nr:hypothetical protein [Candidatus Heimdallarchaeota archaeon]
MEEEKKKITLGKEMSEKHPKEKDLLKSEEYRMDIAGKLFSLISSPRIPCVYRFLARLKRKVSKAKLQEAVNNIISRFPYYQVTMRSGFFWTYWETSKKIPQVRSDTEYPCQYIPIKKKEVFPYRIIAHENCIITEFNHSLTDGAGAVQFLRSLVGEYLHLQGVKINDWGNLFRPGEVPDPGEYEYSHRKYFQRHIPLRQKFMKAFHLPYQLEKKGIFHTVEGTASVQESLQLSRSMGVTLTELLATAYLDALQEIWKNLRKKGRIKGKRPIRLMVPINIRNILPSNTMRNFSAYVAPGIDPRLGDFSFDEILEQVHHYKNLELNDKFIIQQISKNVKIELHPFLHGLPLFIKKWFSKPIYKHFGEAMFSGILTNLGPITMPNDLREEVIDIDLLLMSHPHFRTGCAVISYQDTLHMNFGRPAKKANLEELFFSKLQELGLEIQITRSH